MNVFWKTSAGILTAVILWINLCKNNKDSSVLLSLSVCAMAIISSISFLQPVISFIKRLQGIGKLDENLVNVVLKAVGIAMVTEIAVLICRDAGNESMGKTLSFVSLSAVLWLSIPVFEHLLNLLEGILGAL